MTILFGKKRAVKSCAAKNMQWKSRLLRLESLENRELLSVDPAFVGPLMAKANSEIVVNSLEDNMIDDEFTTLREAINQAVAGDTITFDASLQGGTIALSGSEIAINKTLTIDATSVGGITVDAQRRSRVFHTSGGSNAAPVTLKGLTLQNGYTTEQGGAILQDGGCVNVESCVFQNNEATAAGGAISYLSQNTSFVVDCEFSGNRSGDGGGVIYTGFYGGKLTIEGSKFIGNEGAIAGALYLNSSFYVANSLFVGNVGGSFRSCGAALTNDSGGEFVNSTFVANSGGGLYCMYCTTVVRNSIFVGNGTDYRTEGGCSVVGDYNLSESGWGSNAIKYDASKPLFVDAANGDYTLADNSQAIDLGNDAYVSTETDLAGNPRKVGTVDVGAYEAQTSIVTSVKIDGERAIGKTLTASAVPNASASTATYEWRKGGVLKGTGATFTPTEAGADWTIIATVTGAFSGTVEKSFEIVETASTVVTTLEDIVDPFDEKISLREAIALYSVAGDTITFDASLQGATITLTQGEIAINKTLTIDATSVGGITVDAQGKSRIFNVNGGTSDAPVALKGLTLQNGYASSGGAIYTYNNQSVIYALNCEFIGNRADQYGGAVYVHGGDATFENVVFKNNRADGSNGHGGVIYSQATADRGEDTDILFKNCLVVGNYGRSGALTLLGRSFTAVGCTFADNSCGVSMYGIFYTRYTNTFKNSIVLGSFRVEGSVSADYVLSDYWGTSGTNVGYDSSKPLFVDRENGDYRLVENSQAIGLGNNDYVSTEIDLEGYSRIALGTVDVGAYEYHIPLESFATSTNTPEYRVPITTTLEPTGATATYAWYRVDEEGVATAISGATKSSYTPTAADVGHKLRVDVVATDDYRGRFTTTSEFVYGDIDGASVSTSVSGGPFVGTVLTAKVAPSLATTTFQWYRVDAEGAKTAISGATKAKYTATTADLGYRLEVSVDAFGYWRGSASVCTENVVRAKLSKITLSTNAPLLGKTQTATYSPNYATASYQWARVDKNGVATEITGATKATYTPTAADVGYYLRVVATGTQNTVGSVSATSTTPTKIQFEGVGLSTSSPEVDGTTTAVGLLPSGATATYAWYRGADRSNPIGTGASYVVVLDDVNSTLTVVATGTGDYSGSVSATTSVVPKVKLGTPEFKSAKNVSDSAITVSWSPVSYATKYELQYKASDEASYKTLTVSGTSRKLTDLKPNREYSFILKALGDATKCITSEAAASSAQTLRRPLTSVSISGTLYVGETLTASSETTASYVWRRGSTVVSEGASYVVSLDDVNSVLTVVATGTGDYTGVVSASTSVVPKVKPAAPTLASTSATDTTISVSWNEIENANGYRVGYKLASESAWTYAFVASGTSYQATNLTRNRDYEFVVEALGSEKYETSDVSATSIAKTLRTELTSVSISGTLQIGEMLTASGIQPTDATVSYAWYRGADRSNPIATGVSYLVKLEDVNSKLTVVATGEGDCVGTVDDTTAVVPKVKLAAPTLESTGATDASISVSWNEVENASGYRLRYKLATSSDWTTIDDLTATSFEANGLARNREYEFVVEALGSEKYATSLEGATRVSTLRTDVLSVSVSGVAKVGETLSASDLSPDDATVQYVWTKDGTPMFVGEGVEFASYAPTVAGAGWKLVVVGIGDYQGTAESASFSVVEAESTVVTTNADVVDKYDGVVSLREAIQYASVGDTITFAESLRGRTIALNGTQLEIVKSLTLDASNFYDDVDRTPGLTIDADGNSRVFLVGSDASNVSFVGLKITGGKTDENGGGIYASSETNATVSNSWIYGNSAKLGGGVYVEQEATVKLTNVKTFGNQAERGGGIYAVRKSWTTAINTRISDNTVVYSGGGVYAEEGVEGANVTLKNAEVVQNQAGTPTPTDAPIPVYYPGWYCAPPKILATTADDPREDANSGGGIYVGAGSTMTLANATVAGNDAESGGGISAAGVLTLTNSIVAQNKSDVEGDSDVGVKSESATINAKNVLSTYVFETGDNFVYYEGDALFQDAENGDYSLPSDSVARDQGDLSLVSEEDKKELTTDVNGNSFTTSLAKLSLGASQYHDSLESVSIIVNADKLESGALLTASGLAPDGATASYQWYRVDDAGNLTEIKKDANAETYSATLDDVGFYLLVKARGIGDYGGVVESERTNAKVTTSLTSVSISGTLQVGETLKADGLLPEGAKATYRWYRGEDRSTPLGTGDSYDVVLDDVGYKLTVVATGSASDCYEGEVSCTTAEIVPQVKLAAPTLESPSATDASIAVSWDAVANATGYELRYAPSDDDQWTTISNVASPYDAKDLTRNREYRFQVKALGDGAYANSEFSEILLASTLQTELSSVSFSGIAKVGETLTANVDPTNANVEYQWYRGDVPITNATDATYLVLIDDVGKTLTVKATGIGGYVGTVEATTAVVPKVKSTTPKIESTRATDSTITVSWSPVFEDAEYKLRYRRYASEPSSDDWESVWVNGTSYTLDKLTPNQKYQIQVAALENDKYDASDATDVKVDTLTSGGERLSISETGDGESVPQFSASLSDVEDAVYVWYRVEEDKTETEISVGAAYSATIFDVGRQLVVKAKASESDVDCLAQTTTDVVPIPSKIKIDSSQANAAYLKQAVAVIADEGTISFTQDATITIDATLMIANGKSLTIDGTGADIVFDGEEKRRLFEIEAENSLTLTNVTIQNGFADDYGGAIKNAGTLTLNGVTLTRNSATKNGGAVFNDFGATLTVNDGTISENSARNGGAVANYGEMKILGETTISNNGAERFGGAYFGFGSLEVGGDSTVTFSENTAGYDKDGNVVLGGAKGGAIYNDVNGASEGSVKLTGNVVFSGNKATARGGAIQTYSTLTIAPATGGKVSFENNSALKYGGAIDVGTKGAATISGGASFIGNTAPGADDVDGFGGAIFSVDKLTFEQGGNYKFSENVAAKSGGAIDACAGTLNLAGTFDFSANQAQAKYVDDESDDPETKSGVGGAIATAATTDATNAEFTWGEGDKANDASRGNCVAIDTTVSNLGADKFGLELGDDYTAFKVIREKFESLASVAYPQTFASNAVSATITVEGATTTFGADGVTPEELGLGEGEYEALIQYEIADGVKSAVYSLVLTIDAGASVEVRETSIADGRGVKFDFNLTKKDGRAVSVWEISWGDGSTSRFENLSKSQTAAHYYAQDGTFDVSLKVVYLDGASESFDAFSTQTIGASVVKTEALSTIFEDVDDLFEDAFVEFENPNVYGPAFLR